MKLITKLREAMSSLKDQTSISTASSSDRHILTDIEAAIVHSTSSRDVPADEKYVREILFLVSNAPGSINFLVRRISARLEGKRNPMVILKTLMLVHRLLRGGDRYFEQDLRNLWSSGELQMNLVVLKDHLALFAFNYSMLLRDRIEWHINQAGKLEPVISGMELQLLEEKAIELVLHKLSRCQNFLDRIIECLPVSILASSPVIQLTLSIILKESFGVYASFCEGIETISDCFFNLKKPARVSILDILKKGCLQTPQIHDFYESCKRMFSCRNLNYPSLQIITAAEVLAIEHSCDNFLERNSKVERKGSESRRQNSGLPQRYNIENHEIIPHLFSSKLETKITTIWVEFDEEDSQIAINQLEDSLTSYLEGKSMLSGQTMQ